jgi:integrase
MDQSNMLTRRQAAKKTGISPSHFNYLIHQEPFSSFLIEDEKNQWFVNSAVLPKIKDYYQTHNESFHYYYTHPDYLIAYRVAPILNKSNQDLIREIEEGKWEEFVVKVPRLSPQRTHQEKPNEYIFFFEKSKLLQNRYNTIEQIAKNTTLISRSRLQAYRNQGLLPQPEHFKGTNLFDEQEVLDLLPTLKMEAQGQVSKQKKTQLSNAFEFLNVEQQKHITKYLQYREKGGIIDHSGYRSRSSIANKAVTIENMKSKLASAFILIICGRCGIEDDFHKNPLSRHERPEGYDPDVFDVYSVSKDDYFYLTANRKPTTLFQLFHQLRPFYYFLLENLEEDMVESDDIEDYRMYKRIERRIKKFLNQFPQNMDEINQSEYEIRSKTFLTREQMILIKQYILEDVKAIDPIKNATMWQLSCSGGIRPEELPKLKINHFQLNSQGFIDQDYSGWGCLKLPAEATKQNNSPSHPEYHTPIPPSTVVQLNLYLKRLYRLQGEEVPKGEGFLFRPDYALPFQNYRSKIRFDFINRLRERLDFIDEQQKHDFIFKSSRHSLNNIIMRTFITKDQALNEAKRTASDHQLRHRPSKSVGETYYLQDITKEQYLQVLDATINFPWDLGELKKWEIDMGYRMPEVQVEHEISEVYEDHQEYQQRLHEIDSQLETMKEKPNEMNEIQWIKQRKMLLEQRLFILTKL